MKKLTIRLENPLDQDTLTYSIKLEDDKSADDVAEWLRIFLPLLLKDAIALYASVIVYTEEVK